MDPSVRNTAANPAGPATKVPAAPPTKPTGPPAAPGTSSRGIKSDFDTFLKMLTVQMTNQDPLNPVESSDFAVQLATFSGVEQQVLGNTLLESIASQLGTSGLVQMAGWVGKEARAAVAGHFNGAPLTIVPNPDKKADKAELVVRDAKGAEVQRLPIGTGTDPVTWAGVAEGGTPLPAGNYTFEVISYKGSEVLSKAPAEVYGKVTEVRVVEGEAVLILAGGITLPTKAVTALRDTGAR